MDPKEEELIRPMLKGEAYINVHFLFGRQIEIMAMLVYEENKSIINEEEKIDPWGFQIIGSDFDGIVDPLDGYWTHEQMPLLREYLVLHAKYFLSMKSSKRLPDYDSLSPETIIQKFFFENARGF